MTDSNHPNEAPSPQILMYLNPSNGMQPECDSGIIFTKLLTNQLLAKEYQINIAHDTDLGWPGVQFHPITLGTNKYAVRFEFDGVGIKRIINEVERLDACLLHQTEHGANMIAAFVQKGVEDIPLVSFYHYFCVFNVNSRQIEHDPSLNQGKLGKSVLRRQLETAELSKQIIIHSSFGKNLLLKSAKYMNGEDFSDKINLIPAPVDLSLHPSSTPEPSLDKAQIFLNSRLYDHYGIPTLIKYLKTFYRRYEIDFNLVVTNPTNGRSQERNELDSSIQKNLTLLKTLPFVKICPQLSCQSYHQMLSKITLGLAPYRPALWSMSAIDVMASWKPILAPDMGAFPEMVPSELLYTDCNTFCDSLARLLTDESFYREMQIACRTKAEIADCHVVGDKFDRIFKEVIGTC